MPQLLKEYANPLHIEITRSRLVGRGIIFVHIFALVMVLVSKTPYLLALVLLVIIGFSLFAFLKQYRSTVRTIKTLILDSTGWSLLSADEQEPVDVSLNSYYSHPCVIILNFLAGKDRRTIILLHDNCDREISRQLRVRLGINAAA